MRVKSLASVARAPWTAVQPFRYAPLSRPLRRRNLSSACDKPTPKGRTIKSILDWKPEEKVCDVVVDGWVRSIRAMKTRAFIALGDGSSLAPLQAVVPGSDLQEGLATGAAVRLTGSWRPSEGAGQSHELQVEKVQVLGPSDATTFPIQKKYQTPEFLRTLPHLRSRTPFNSALLRFRSDVMATLTQFFNSRSFVQTHPPVITSSDCEGAGEVFTVASSTKHVREDGIEEEFFRDPKYLTVSTQLHLESLAQAVGNVWTLAPTFRAEQSDTSRHLSEFYMLEAEMSFVNDLDGVMDLAEDMLRDLSSRLYDHAIGQELRAQSAASVDRATPEEINERWLRLGEKSWPRLTYTDAIKLLQEKEQEFEHRPFWGASLHSDHERYIARVVGQGKPVFVTHYPRAQKAFYMRATEGQPEKNATVDCFDLLVPEYCEIAGGSMREHRLPQLLDSMGRSGLVTPPLEGGTQSAGSLDWYVDLRRWGCPPHGGFGIGFDRLLGYLAGVQSIRDTVTFPRWYGRCDC